MRLAKACLGTVRVTSFRPLAFKHGCSYHSYDHSQPPPFPPAETAILSAALEHVPEHGFSMNALTVGARKAGYLDASVHLLPRGVFDLINYHLVSQRLALKESVQFPNEPGLGIGAKVRSLTLARLHANEGIIHRWQEALAVMAQPSYVSPSLAELARLADEIWFLAGDTSVDTSWYTKRASLSAIYSATEIFMSQDKSKDFVETKQFLDARLAEVGKVGGVLGSLGQWAGYTGHATINVLRSKGARI